MVKKVKATAKKSTKTKTGIGTGTKAKAGAKNPKGKKKEYHLPISMLPSKQTKGKEIILTTLAFGAAGVAGYFGWQYYQKRKRSKTGDLDDAIRKVSPASVMNADDSVTDKPVFSFPVDTAKIKSKVKAKKSGTTGEGGDFPLKKGSKGENVRLLQQALIDKYGKAILPRYGADGDFGSETQAALKKKGLPASITESAFNVLVAGSGSNTGGSGLTGLAKKLYNAAVAKNITSVVNLLKGIENKEQYQQVSSAFLEQRLHGVRQTLVNGMLGSFTGEDEKQQMRLEFIRMGLQYDGSRWSLSGFDGKTIVTKEPTIVWVTPTQSVNVPQLMVLGNEVTQRLDFTLFENNDKYFLVKTQSVKYL